MFEETEQRQKDKYQSQIDQISQRLLLKWPLTEEQISKDEETEKRQYTVCTYTDNLFFSGLNMIFYSLYEVE